MLSVGLFDGIGALRVALDTLGVQVIGHVSVEKEAAARRVVEAHYPGTVSLSAVEDINEEVVQSWATRFSQCALVLLGAGPPCQGVSGLNCERQGALIRMLGRPCFRMFRGCGAPEAVLSLVSGVHYYGISRING